MINELRKILEEAPEGATHTALITTLLNTAPHDIYLVHKRGDTWLRYNDVKATWETMKKSGINFLFTIRSLSDIKLIVSLCDELADQTGGCTQELLDRLK